MTQIKNDRLLKALARKPVDETPVWLMRQAGRYLPEYRALRQQHKDFMTLCKTPELACQVTLQPIERFPLDAAIIFSDILTIPDAMGLGLSFGAGEGPQFAKPVRDVKAIEALPIPEMKELSYVFEAIKLVVRELDYAIPLIGFSGSPWTLATYMVEGGSSKTFSIIKKMAFTEPSAFNLLLEKLVAAVSEYLVEQIKAGVQAVMLFDTWGGVLTEEDYRKLSLQPMSKVITNVKQSYPEIPVILFTKNGEQWLKHMVASGADALGIDWMTSLQSARAMTEGKVALQGNLDPSVLYGSPDFIRDRVRKIFESYGDGPGHIFNLGHGIYPDAPPENVAILVDAVHEFSRSECCS